MVRYKSIFSLICCLFILLGFFSGDKKKEKKPSFEELWTYDVTKDLENTEEKSQAITVPAIFDKERIYLASKNGFVFALNKADGIKTWDFDAGSPITQSLILADEKLFCATDKEIFCLNKADGQLIWRKGLGIEITSPITYLIENLYLSTNQNNIFCLKGANGEILWEYDVGAPVYAAFAVDYRYILFGSDNGYIYSLLGDDGRLSWKLKLEDKIRSTPLLYKDKLFIGTFDNYIYAINFKNKKVKWKVRTGADIQAPAVGWKDYIFVASFDSYLYCLKQGNGHLRYKRKLPARPYNAPVIHNNVMYIQTLSNKLLAINPATGKGLSSYSAASLITSPLSVSNEDDSLFIGTNEGKLIALSIKLSEKKKKADEVAEVSELERDEEEILEETAKDTELLEAGKEIQKALEETEVKAEKKKPEKKDEELLTEGELTPVIDLNIPYNITLHQECMARYREGNYAGAAIGWTEMVAKLDPNYYTIVIGLYCTSDSLVKIYDNKTSETFIFFLPKPFQGKICYQVCLGLFTSIEEAQETLNQLPEFFQQEKPAIAQLSNFLH